MIGFFSSLFGYFVSWWGAFVLAALDSSMLFFLPFGIDAVVIFLAAQHPELAWLPPILATAGSVMGAAVTFWIGRRVGEPGLEMLTGEARLEAIKCRVRKRGAALALAAVFPPPFPLTPFIIACGALAVSRRRFFTTFATVRLLRFGAEAWLAVLYGKRLLVWLQSDTFERVIALFVVVAVAGTAWSAWSLWRKTRVHRQPRPTTA